MPIPLIVAALVIVAVIIWRAVKSNDCSGKEISAAALAAEIQKFIDGSATVLDSDEIYTFSLADAALEKVRSEVLEILDRRLKTEKNAWCDERGIADLQKIYADLLK